MEISYEVGEVWRLLRSYLQAHDRLALETGGGALANLVWGEGKELYTKAAELCTIGKWANFLHGIADDYLLDVSACCHVQNKPKQGQHQKI